MTYTEYVKGVKINSNMPFNGDYPGHWTIDTHFKIPYLQDWITSLNSKYGLDEIKKIYSGTITNYKSYPVYPYVWRIEFDATSPPLLALLIPLIEIILTVVIVALVSYVVVTIESNPTTAISIPIIALGVLVLGIGYVYSKIRKKGGRK